MSFSWKRLGVASVAVLCCAIMFLVSTGARLDLSPVQHLSGGSDRSNSLMPQLSNVIESAANDAGDGNGISHGSTETFTAAPNEPLPANSNGHTSMATGDCASVKSAFLLKHGRLLEEHKVAGPQTDEWTGRAPVCGIHQVYNRTGMILALDDAAGAGDKQWMVGHTKELRVRSCTPHNGFAAAEEGCPDLFISARLHGASIVPSDPVTPIAASQRRVADLCEWRIRITPTDVGSHKLEVNAIWLNGMGPERSTGSPVTLRKTHSKFGKKPHQKYVFNGPCEAQSAILGTPVELKVQEGDIASTVADLPRCSAGNVSGRWVKHDNTIPCKEGSALCVGHPGLLNDAKPFNKDYVWAPHGCRYQFWKAGDGPKRQCTKRKGQLFLMGDSTTREYAQSLRLFDLSKTGLHPTYANWRIEHKWFSRKMARDALQRLVGELRKANPVVLAVNLGPLHLIAGLLEEDWRYYVDQWVEIMSPDAATGKNPFPNIERRIFLGPSTIHYATNDMSEQRMVRWTAYAKEKLLPLGFEYVDAHAISNGRIETSWDGVHHAAERGKAQMKHARSGRDAPLYKWNGGVSTMLTTVLLNVLCSDASSSSP